MEKEKLINLTKKLSKFGRGKNPSDIYTKLTKDSTYQDFYKILSAEDLILLCFMIPKYEEDLNLLYDKIKNNLFAFSTITVDNEDAMETCSYCGGDGEVECGNCFGDGEIDCDECGGDGEIETGEDEYEECRSCGGDGKIRCEECSKGSVTCDNCDGYGEVKLDDYVEATQNIYISYDNVLFDKILLLNEFDRIEPSDLISDLSKIILLSSDNGQTDILPDPSDGDDYLYEYSDYEITLRKSIKKITVDNITDIF